MRLLVIKNLKMKTNWWREVEAILEQKSLLKHRFYQAWTMGELSREDLAFYAQQYYKQESNFPRYVSAVHSNCPDLEKRQMLLENLKDEETGTENHPELWLRFAESVGADRASVALAEMLPQTKECIETFETLSRQKNWVSGLAALYAYEAQQPAVAATKIEGLKKCYNVDSSEALRFFEVHQEADVWHSAAEKKILLEQGDANPALREAVCDSVSRACDALNTLLDGICEKRGICVPVLQ
jgi:pyrroloquinoline-quinone synthase